MGGVASAFNRLFRRKKNCRILMVGLDASGKTTILYKLAEGFAPDTIPTIGFNVETIEYKNVSMNCWDIGGQSKLRALWRHYYIGSNALIWVVDCGDIDRIVESRDQLHATLSDPELDNVFVLVYANKVDLPNALNASDVANLLRMDTLNGKHTWHVQSSIATSGDGLYEGLDILVDMMNSK